MYAGELLSVVAMASAKMSVLVLSDRVAPRKERFYNGMRALILFWTTFSIFAIAFQCGLPKPWVYDPDDCPTKGYVYYPIIILNIVTDGILATWILPTLWNLLMDTGKRMTVMLLFGSRLVVCCFAIVQLTSLARHIRDPDVTCTLHCLGVKLDADRYRRSVRSHIVGSLRHSSFSTPGNGPAD